MTRRNFVNLYVLVAVVFSTIFTFNFRFITYIGIGLAVMVGMKLFWVARDKFHSHEFTLTEPPMELTKGYCWAQCPCGEWTVVQHG